ncbi:MAG: TonB-dependent receptor [Alphaproteobacteria bacterium]
MKTKLPFGRSMALLSASTAALLTTFATAPSFAQGATAEAPVQTVTRETIITTARKRDEGIQDVPVTITAVGQETLQRFNIEEVADLSARVPSLNVQLGGSGSGAQVTLRGVGSTNISAAFDSAVALNFDGISIGSMRVLQSGFFDVAQIEVLKGPQSLFFGKGSSAGVISITSANPTDEFEVGGTASYEIEERGYTLEGYVSGPITDELGFRLAAHWNDIDRQYVNQAHFVDPTLDKNKGQENMLLRLTLQWDPADNFSANLKANYVGHRNDGSIQDAILDCGADGIADPILHPLGFPIEPGYECDHKRKRQWRYSGAPDLAQNAPTVDGTNRPDLRGGTPFGKSDIWYLRLELDWDITDDINLTTVTGYFDQTAQDSDWYSYGGVCADQAACPWYNMAEASGGAPFVGLPELNNTSYTLGGGITDHQLEQFSQEVRLTSDYDAPVNFMLGFFFEDRNSEFNTNQYAVNFATIFGPSGLTGPDSSGFTSDWFKRHIYDMRAISIFGQLIWDITEDLELSGGVRWSDERKRNNVLVPYMHWFGSGVLGFVPSGFDTGDIIFKDDNLSPEVALTWSATEEINLFIAYKTGFKSGGIDNSALPSRNLADFASMDPEVRAAAADGLIFDSETAKGGEAGMKALFFDGNLQLNFTGYYYVFQNLQVQNFDAVNTQFQTGNASELTNKGLELEFNWIAPVDGLTLFGTLALTSTKYTKEFDPNPNNDIPVTEENLEGRKAARAPTWSGNIGFDYRRPVGNGLELAFNGNLAFSSKYFTNEDSFEDTRQSSYATIDLAASIGSIEGSWEFAVVGRNITDHRAITTSGPRPFATVPDEVWNLARGRQIFLEASVRY